MNKKTFFAFCLCIIATGGLLSFKFIKDENSIRDRETANPCLTFPEGIMADVIADNIATAGLLSFKCTKADKPVRDHETANAGLTLPEGFKAAVIADNLGSARHLVATPQGD